MPIKKDAGISDSFGNIENLNGMAASTIGWAAASSGDQASR